MEMEQAAVTMMNGKVPLRSADRYGQSTQLDGELEAAGSSALARAPGSTRPLSSPVEEAGSLAGTLAAIPGRRRASPCLPCSARDGRPCSQRAAAGPEWCRPSAAWKKAK